MFMNIVYVSKTRPKKCIIFSKTRPKKCKEKRKTRPKKCNKGLRADRLTGLKPDCSTEPQFDYQNGEAIQT